MGNHMNVISLNNITEIYLSSGYMNQIDCQ